MNGRRRRGSHIYCQPNKQKVIPGFSEAITQKQNKRKTYQGINCEKKN
jgi:hypothetical protein